MRRILAVILLLSTMILPVNAMDFTAPEAPASAAEYMPAQSTTFWQDFFFVIREGIKELRPQLVSGMGVCVRVFAIALLTSVLLPLSVNTNYVLELVATVVIGGQLLHTANAMITLGRETVVSLSEYGKLLLPALAGALAAQGGTITSAALYSGTAMFSALLSSLISRLLIPMAYIYLSLCIANSALGEGILKQLCSFVKWLMTWSLKIIIYVFVGYMSITGVISGSVDASAIKATKLTLSGVVPVVGSILSDASETILVSAGIMKNAVGAYGLVALAAILIGPFVRIGAQYILLKLTGMITGIVATKEPAQLIGDFTGTMGYILAMTGTACLLLMTSVVCFMKGVA